MRRSVLAAVLAVLAAPTLCAAAEKRPTNGDDTQGGCATEEPASICGGAPHSLCHTLTV